MNIVKKQNGDDLVITLDGRLDTKTAPELDNELKTSLTGIKTLTFEISELAYISSAGLRVLLSAQKIMNKQGTMTIKGASQDIMEIFDITGFTDLLNIE